MTACLLHPAATQALAHSRVEPMLMDAVAFAQLPPSEMRYSHVLLKELVHHIPAGGCSLCSYLCAMYLPRALRSSSRWIATSVASC